MNEESLHDLQDTVKWTMESQMGNKGKGAEKFPSVLSSK